MEVEVAPEGRRYVVVCRGPHCREHGSMPLRRRLASLLAGRPDVGLIGYACFGLCDHGPNVAFYPEGIWYGGLNQANSAERVARHVSGDGALACPPLEVDAEQRGRHLRNITELVRLFERDADRGRRWWWPF